VLERRRDVRHPPAAVRVKVVIPALDEERSIAKVIAALPRERLAAIVVADNGSRDRTAEVARAAGAEVVAAPRRGYGAACLVGIAAAGDCDVVVFVDADLSDHPEELPLLLAPLERGEADLTIGSRTLRRDSARALLPQARFGNWLAAFLLRRAFGVEVTDLGPFRAIRKEALDALAMDDQDFGWTVQMQARAFAQGLRVVEVPVSYRKRIGTSKITGTVRGTVLAGRKILLTIWREWRSARRPRPDRSRPA
jgi:glycosyltransferase involved in cell wall biosynthesis